MFEGLFSLNGLSLDRLRNFCAIADSGSITRAAHHDAGRMALYSRQIKELETFFGVALRRRKGKGIVLTAAGERLAALARQQFQGLEDFRQSCRDLPVELVLAASNSVLEWLVLPQCAELRRRLPEARFRMQSMRPSDIISGLNQQSVDFGFVRIGAALAGLHFEKLRSLGYALFVPPRLAHGITRQNLRDKISSLPLACPSSGKLRDRLVADAAKANWPLLIELSCSSATHAACAVLSGGYAALLPDLAENQLRQAGVKRFALPFLKSQTRSYALAWHPRTAAVRDIIAPAREHLIELLGEPQNSAEHLP